jgi:hypothetical protein
VPIDQNGLLERIMSDPAQNRRRKGQLLIIHDVIAQVNEFSVYAEVLELDVEPVGHIDDIVAMCGITAYTTDKMT